MSDRDCNRCEENKQIADWGVCASCFQDDCREFAERALGDKDND